MGIKGAPFRLTIGVNALGFGGHALVFPVVPLWAASGGSGAFGAGLTTGVFMLATVATQLVVPWLMNRVGHRWVLGGGLMLLGAPTPLLALSAVPAPVIALCALRGVGFGLMTVAGAALVAELVPPEQHGRAASWYGTAAGAPQLLLLALGVASVEQFGFLPVFLAGAVPVLGTLLVPLIRMPDRVEAVRPPGNDLPAYTEEGPAPRGGVVRAGLGPLAAMLVCAMAQGGLVTFLPLALRDSGAVAPVALFAVSAGGLVGRLAAGVLVDRFRIGGRIVGPATLVAALGVALAAGFVGAGGAATAVGVLVGVTLVGLGFGAVQNDSLTALFAAFGPARYGTASAAWNIAFDAGAGVGATALGAIADPFGYPVAFGVAAVLCASAVMVRPGSPSAGRARQRPRAGADCR